jgi:hypothetical protein
VRNYRNEVALWAAWCASEGLNPATVTAVDIKHYRQALLEAGYKPINVRWKLTIVRRIDNPAAGVKAPASLVAGDGPGESWRSPPPIRKNFGEHKKIRV